MTLSSAAPARSDIKTFYRNSQILNYFELEFFTGVKCLGIATIPNTDIANSAFPTVFITPDCKYLYKMDPYKSLDTFESMSPLGLIVHPSGESIYYFNFHQIIKISLDSRKISLVAGQSFEHAAPPIADGQAKTEANFYNLMDLKFWSNHTIIVSEAEEGGWERPSTHAIRMLHLKNDTVTTLIGGHVAAGYKNGHVSVARFNLPSGMAVDQARNILYVADAHNHAIRSIDLISNMVHTFAGSEPAEAGYVDGYFKDARFNYPSSVLFDPKTNSIIVADSGNNCIRELLLNSNTTLTISGDGLPGFYDGIGKDAQLNSPFNMAFDPKNEEVYIRELYGMSVRKFNRKSKILETLVKNTGVGYITGPLGQARFNTPVFQVMDTRSSSETNAVLFTDAQNNAIMRLDIDSGIVETLAGFEGISGMKNGPTEFALFNHPTGIAVDPISKAVFVADSGNRMIRRIDASNKVTIFAGSGEKGFSDDYGQNATFEIIYAMTIHIPTRTLYVSDIANYAVRKISIDDALVTTIAGTGSYGYANGVGRQAAFSNIHGLVVDPNGEYIYVSDSFNNFIRRIRISDNMVSTLVGNGWMGCVDGEGSNAKVLFPHQITMDNSGNIFFVEYHGHSVRKVTRDGKTSTIYGCQAAGYRNGITRQQVRFRYPMGIVYNPVEDSLIISDSGNRAIRRIKDGRVTTLAGFGASSYRNSSDGQYKTFTGGLIKPVGMMLSGQDLLVLDTGNHMIVKFESNMKVTRIAGNGEIGWTDSNNDLFDCEFNAPQAMIQLSKNDSTVLVADTGNHVLRMIDWKKESVTTLVGNGVAGLVNGRPAIAQFNRPTGLALDLFSKVTLIYVCDSGNNAIRALTIGPSGVTVAVAVGTGLKGFKDGTPAKSELNEPEDITISSEGYMYIADTMNNAVRVWNCKKGNVTTLIGTETSELSLRRPRGLVVHPTERILYISDSGNNRIVSFNLDTNASSIIVGSGQFVESGPILSSLQNPSKLVYDAADDHLIILDTNRNAIRKLYMGPGNSLATVSASQAMVEGTNTVVKFVSISIGILFAMALFIFSARLRFIRSKKTDNVFSKLTSLAMKKNDAAVDQSMTMNATHSVAIALPGYLKFDNIEKIIQIESLLGRGGTASVFKGRLVDQGLIKTHGFIDVAVKRLTKITDITDFNYEVIIMSSLPKDCPYVAKLIGYQDSPPLIVMKFYAISLTQYLDELKTKIPYGTVLSISSDIAKGMQAIHSKGIIHFDLKPMNVMLDVGASFKSFTCVICDFGFANFLDAGRKQLVAGMRAPTTNGITARYAAPELFETAFSTNLSHHRRNAKIDLMIDVFAFAMTLYAVACQQKPWHEIDMYDAIEEVIMKGLRPTLPEDINETIAGIITRCWSQEPELRMTFDEIVEVLLQEISDYSAGASKTDTGSVVQIPSNDHTATNNVDSSSTSYSTTQIAYQNNINKNV